MADLNQLRLFIGDYSELPELDIPEGYELSYLDPNDEDMKRQWKELNDVAFETETEYEKVVGEHWGYYPGCTHIICKDGKMVATATAIYQEGKPKNFGYIHMVAADKGHSGKGLGYQVCLSVLRKHKEFGCNGTWLTTDDFRLPACATYLKLGMRPVFTIPEHKQRWIDVLKNISREDLIPYVEGLEVPKEEDLLC